MRVRAHLTVAAVVPLALAGLVGCGASGDDETTET